MKLTTILVMGAAALAVPAFAQAANESAAPAGSAAASQNANANDAAPANDAATPASQNADASSGANGKMAMSGNGASATTTGDASALSSVPDTQKKYKRSARAGDFQKEAETTKQLNQQVASAGGIPKQ